MGKRQFQDRNPGRGIPERLALDHLSGQLNLVQRRIVLGIARNPYMRAAAMRAVGNDLSTNSVGAYASAVVVSVDTLRASSRSTIFIIGDEAVSAFFILTTRWRSTASL